MALFRKKSTLQRVTEPLRGTHPRQGCGQVGAVAAGSRWAYSGELGRLGAAQEAAAVVKLGTVALFGLGYVLGTRAGRERYAQLVALAQRASERPTGTEVA